MSMPSLESEETPLAPDELGLAGLSSDPLPHAESTAVGELAPTAIEVPRTASSRPGTAGR